MRNRNVWVLIATFILIAVVAVISILMPEKQRIADPSATLVPQSEPLPSTDAPAVSPTQAPVNAYLLVTVNGMLYEPIPITGEASYTLRQGDEMENVIRVTHDSVCMESSTCENQDCVLQGTVSLENMSSRVLGNMIICLPNEITLELYTPEGIVEVFQQLEGM